MSDTTDPCKIALLGNPNSGKTSLFNQLTGLQQKVGNFPGVTVEKKTGQLKLPGGRKAILTDLPGTYSLYPTSSEERIAVQIFTNPNDEEYPDAIIYVADIQKLEKHLLLFTQVRDLGVPAILGLNMADLAEQEGINIDLEKLQRQLGSPVVQISARTGKGIPRLLSILEGCIEAPTPNTQSTFYRPSQEEARMTAEMEADFPSYSPYQRLLLAHHHQWLPGLSTQQRQSIAAAVDRTGFQDIPLQVRETMQRYDRFTPLVQQAIQTEDRPGRSKTERLDTVLTHFIWGPIIFFSIMLLVFQAIFSWAGTPMDGIEWLFAELGMGIRAILPESWIADLVADGILAGLGGILVFIPQIAILFFLIALLEEVGYMARAAFMFDRIMQSFGLNGRSIVALISGAACAIPAVMSTRTIANWKERLITILVTPFISCSARIPVYTVLIGFVVPAVTVWGFFNLQGLAFMGLYLLGILAAFLTALVFKQILPTREHSFLMLELPEYRRPNMRNVVLTVWEKVKTFTLEAGKIILFISVILWGLSSYGPPKAMQRAESEALQLAKDRELDASATANLIASQRIEASFAGHIGKFIEPVIRPLGYDWKIGIALITSFAAREVFVGTMATIYSIGSADDEASIKDRMAKEVNPVNGQPVYTMATALSLLLFYVFAMQCMSTLAVVKRETNSWKWPIIQFVFMTALAYLSALAAYQFLS